MVGTNTKNLIQKGNSTPERDALVSMIPLPGGRVGNYSINGAITTLSVPNGQWRISPFITACDFSVDEIGVSCTATAGPASQVAIILYDSDPATGRPTNPIQQSPAIITAAPGNLNVPFFQLFEAGKLYWLGHKASLSPTMRFLSVGCSKVIGVSTGAAPAPFQSLIRTKAYADPLDVWPFANSQFSTATPMQITLRVA